MHFPWPGDDVVTLRLPAAHRLPWSLGQGQVLLGRSESERIFPFQGFYPNNLRAGVELPTDNSKTPAEKGGVWLHDVRNQLLSFPPEF